MTVKSDDITREYFDSMLITPRYLDGDIASTKINMFGRDFATPVMTAALSHLHKICDNAMCEFALGAKKSGALHFVGMCEDDELTQILETGADTVKIIKPHKDDAKVFDKISRAAKGGAFAVGMDIDHAIAPNGDYDNIFGLEMRPKSAAMLAEYVKAAKVPFIVKGVLSAADAEKSVEAGAAAVLVSHHHGMMDCMVPPLMILPEIINAVNGQAKIIVDCGIQNGMDVFKALALGADAVCVGRHLMDPLKDGSDGVSGEINRITDELAAVMARTGARTIDEIDPSVIRFRNF